MRARPLRSRAHGLDRAAGAYQDPPADASEGHRAAPDGSTHRPVASSICHKGWLGNDPSSRAPMAWALASPGGHRVRLAGYLTAPGPSTSSGLPMPPGGDRNTASGRSIVGPCILSRPRMSAAPRTATGALNDNGRGTATGSAFIGIAADRTVSPSGPHPLFLTLQTTPHRGSFGLRGPVRRLKTVRRPPIYPKTPGHLPDVAPSPTPFRCPHAVHRCPSVDSGLAYGEKHGYAIMREVEVLTEGAVKMGPGTLYGTIKRMLKAELVEETDERPDPELDDERRRYYRLTGLGAQVLDAEVARMEQLTRTAWMRREIAEQKLRLEGR